MCGIAGIIHRNGETSNIGAAMTAMLQSMKHRGPDSSGYALYGRPEPGVFVVRFKVAEQEDLRRGLDMQRQAEERRATVDARMRELGARVLDAQGATEYAFRYRVQYEGHLRGFADAIEDLEGAEILSIGASLELIKDLGDASQVCAQYQLGSFPGTHAIGHVRMATESDVDIRSAHPFWAYPFQDIAVVHNGQLTNYWMKRRELERKGHRFMSNCDSELVAVYLAEKLNAGVSLEEAMRRSVEELDGVFTYLVSTADSLGMAKDTMAAKPMVLYEGEECVALASEEVAIRSLFPREIDTSDPYEGEVRVWRN
jgi:glutamate synthase domain-containing protein 1